MLKVAVYDPLRTDSPQEPRKIGHHELISLYGGEVNWADILAGEMGKRTGKLLVTGEQTFFCRISSLTAV